MSQYPVYFIDHYDSFSFNVIDWLVGADASVQINHLYFDDVECMGRILESPAPIVLSPGPHNPRDAHETTALVHKLLGKVPVFGVCLGHQILGVIAGLEIERSHRPFHGSTRTITPKKAVGQFFQMPSTFQAAIYHSLVVRSGSLKEGWQVTAVDNFAEIQALEYRQPGCYPAFGVQFHPESFMTENQGILRQNWLHELKQFYLPDDEKGQGYTSAMAPLSMPS